MRNYGDGYIKPNTENYKEIIEMSKKLGNKYLILEINTKSLKQNIEKEIDKSITYTIISSNPSLGAKAIYATNYKEIRQKIERRDIDVIINIHHIFQPYKIDEVIFKLIAEKNIALIFSLKDFISLSRNDKVKELRKLKTIHMLSKKYNIKTIVGSGAENISELRYGRDLASFTYIAFNNLEYALKTTSTHIEEFIKFSRKLKDQKRIAPGVYEIEGYK